MVYQPASWNGDQAALLTQWLAYIPSEYFDTLNAYLKTQSSPLYNQTGIQGQLAAQINTAFPLAATTSTTAGDTSTSKTSGGGKNRTRDIIIGVCVSLGAALWIALVFWIYKRVKRSNEKAVHRRYSEHMSMFSGNRGPNYGGAHDDHRVSMVPSIAASEIDDRPSSFYASPADNDRSMRQMQRESATGVAYDHHSNPFEDGHESPSNYGPSVFGSTWFANPTPAPRRANQNPFEDMITRSYLSTSGSNGNMGSLPQRRSGVAKRVEVQKGMISQPTLQTNSLEFREQ